MSKYNEVKEMPHLQQIMRSCQVACPFFAKLCFGWFIVQHLSQTKFPGMVYQAKQQKLKQSSVMIFLTKAN